LMSCEFKRVLCVNTAASIITHHEKYVTRPND